MAYRGDLFIRVCRWHRELYMTLLKIIRCEERYTKAVKYWKQSTATLTSLFIFSFPPQNTIVRTFNSPFRTLTYCRLQVEQAEEFRKLTANGTDFLDRCGVGIWCWL